jgi:hypothetical protein
MNLLLTSPGLPGLVLFKALTSEQTTCFSVGYDLRICDGKSEYIRDAMRLVRGLIMIGRERFPLASRYIKLQLSLLNVHYLTDLQIKSIVNAL